MKQLDNIKNYLLSKYPIYNDGFSNVDKPIGNEIVIDENNKYCGISDNLGNYFYIRSLKDASFSSITKGCRVLFYKRSTSCRIVSLIKGGNDINHELAIIDAVSACGGIVTRSLTSKTKVFNEETGTQKITDNLKEFSLILCEFQIVDKVSSKNCQLQICEC